IVILNEMNERGGRQIKRRRPSPLLLPCVTLTLVQEPPLRRRDELRRGPAAIGVIRFGASGQRDHGAVVKVVIPQRVEPKSAGGARANELRVLRLVLVHEQD